MKKVFIFLILTLPIIIHNARADSFPARCEGQWSGTMYIWAQGNLVDSVQMLFTVEPLTDQPGHWSWKTEYISEKMPVTKNYTLFQKQGSLNEYLLDEGDGVILTNNVFGNKMYSLFKVSKAWLTASYEFIGDKLVFEVTSSSKLKEKTKGVTNYPFNFVQRVEFTRVE